MNVYAYKGNYPLGEEPCGSENKLVLHNIKRTNIVIKNCRKFWGDNFRAYTFSSFYDNNTFREINIRR